MTPAAKRSSAERDFKGAATRLAAVLSHYRTVLPQPTTELHYGSAFQLLVATMLSAQCTDQRVNLVTPTLFRAYPDAAHLATADSDALFSLLRTVSYPHAKTRHLLLTAQVLVAEHGGNVPDSQAALLRLPGVGRKTANVVLAEVYGQPCLAVDTHVARVSHRLALVPTIATTATQVEEALCNIIPPAERRNAHHWLLLHGRYICRARQPQCPRCPFLSFCPYMPKTKQ